MAFDGDLGVAKLGGDFAVVDVEDGACFAPAGIHFHCYVDSITRYTDHTMGQ